MSMQEEKVKSQMKDNLNLLTVLQGSNSSLIFSCLETRTRSVSSNSSKMSIVIKEDSKVDHMEKLHSFCMKRSSTISNRSKSQEAETEV